MGGGEMPPPFPFVYVQPGLATSPAGAAWGRHGDLGVGGDRRPETGKRASVNLPRGHKISHLCSSNRRERVAPPCWRPGGACGQLGHGHL